MKDTICWECANACGGCSWSRKKAKPVPGWDAIRRDLSGNIESYVVISCPEFVRDNKRKNEKKPPKIRNWTKEEVDLLREMLGKGMTERECAKALNRTKAAVSNKKQKEGIKIGSKK